MRPRLAIVGLDVGDPESLERWVEEGHLPALSALMARGCHARTSGVELVNEHAIWLTIFSGLSCAQHGYFYFRQLVPGTYDLRTLSALETEARPFWSLLRGGDHRVAIVDPPDCAPEPGLDGVQLTNWAVHYALDAPASEPKEVLETVAARWGRRQTIDERLQASVAHDREIYAKLMRRIRTKGEACRHLAATGDADLSVMVFGETHTGTHQFWKYRAGARPPELARDGGLAHAIRDIYQAVDAEIGRTLDQLPEGTDVFLVSSTGMDDQYPAVDLMEGFCRGLGYQAAPSWTVSATHALRALVPESWRIAVSRHFSRDVRERLLADQFRVSTDWTRTTAFAIPSLYVGFLRVNLRGREPQGTVDISDYDALLARIETDLRQLVDDETGEPAVHDVIRTRAVFGGAPHAHLPDLLVRWKPGRFLRRVSHPGATLSQRTPEFFRGSDHAPRGFVAAAGPSIAARGAQSPVSVLDLAPTFLTLLGEPVPAAMHGAPLTRWIAS